MTMERWNECCGDTTDRDAAGGGSEALPRQRAAAFEETGPADRRQHHRFGFTNPVLISDDGEIIAGHGRVMAAKALGLEAVPTLQLSHLSAEERRAYVLADNKLALNAGWDTRSWRSSYRRLSTSTST